MGWVTVDTYSSFIFFLMQVIFYIPLCTIFLFFILQLSQNIEPKPIKASEIKAYLYAWCGQRKLKPEYEVSPTGAKPKVAFSCKVS